MMKVNESSLKKKAKFHEILLYVRMPNVVTINNNNNNITF